ncbi:hypothetical protein EIP91_010458, partial [Steccherinum ochraceum]
MGPDIEEWKRDVFFSTLAVPVYASGLSALLLVSHSLWRWHAGLSVAPPSEGPKGFIERAGGP